VLVEDEELSGREAGKVAAAAGPVKAALLPLRCEGSKGVEGLRPGVEEREEGELLVEAALRGDVCD